MHQLHRSVTACLLALLLLTPGCTTAPATTELPPGLYQGFGNYQRASSTKSAEAQRLFNQGMQLLYGFNHDEAIRSFELAGEKDPNLAIAWWGIAYARGLHINNPVMSKLQSERAYEAVQKAKARIDHASPVERTLIEAVATRYAMPIPEKRDHLDRAYADAMQAAWKQYPNDPDVGALYAESLMNLQPWDLWTKDGQPKGRTLEIVAVLERVMEIRPDHPGANHFYIHAVEASKTPGRALAAADRLGKLVPGSGHLVHMPSHTYARVGQWAKASDSNAAAIKADRAYFAKAPAPEFYSLYYVHNIHFLAWASMMEGRYEAAIGAARDLERDIPKPFLKEMTHVADGFLPVVYHVLIRFGKWDAILAEPEPEGFRHVSRASWRYARGVALAAKGKTAESRLELEAFEREVKAIPENWVVLNNPAAKVMDVARHMLKGELAFREGKFDESFALLRKGIELEDALAYDEPPGWMQPVRHALGALLMSQGRAKEAEQVYREDLAIYPHNGWALLGLEQALTKQGKTAEAKALASELAMSWSRADVKPVASCYCHPEAR